MKEQKLFSLSSEDIVVVRDIVKAEESVASSKNEEANLQILAQDYPIDGPKPKCDGTD